MAESIGSLKSVIAGYLGTTVAALNNVNGQDLLLLALNNARRMAERNHDFNYAQVDVTLTVASSGASITNAFASPDTSDSVTVTGTLTPDGTGTYTAIGTYLGNTLFSTSNAGTVFLLYNNSTTWILSAEGFSSLNAWTLASASGNPNGTYTAAGTYTGTPVVTGGSQLVGIKRIQNVFLPIRGGDSVPIEFLSNDDWNARIRMQTGRTIYNPNLTLTQLGFYSDNPICVQQGQTLTLVPASQFTFPINIGLSVLRWMPDYFQDSDVDFFVQYAPDFLQWQGILEANKLVKFFVERREGNLAEPDVIVEANQAWQDLLEWDRSISFGTSTPDKAGPLNTQPTPAAQSSAA